MNSSGPVELHRWSQNFRGSPTLRYALGLWQSLWGGVRWTADHNLTSSVPMPHYVRAISTSPLHFPVPSATGLLLDDNIAVAFRMVVTESEFQLAASGDHLSEEQSAEKLKAWRQSDKVSIIADSGFQLPAKDGLLLPDLEAKASY